MSEAIRIFYVEDDETLSFITKDQLEEQGYEVHHFNNGKDAVAAFEQGKYHLAILDIMLPGSDGFTIAGAIRQKDEQIPVLFLSAKSLEEDRLKGFQLGADDYITKPFSMEELLFKIKVFLKRSSAGNQVSKEKSNGKIGRYLLDMERLRLINGQSEQDLTVKEADLLHLFMLNTNNTLKREDILIALWGKNDYFLGRSLDVFISRLRKYLSEDENISIQTLRGVGFRMEVKN
jgi:DNA-binding response OmpR family regulator